MTDTHRQPLPPGRHCRTALIRAGSIIALLASLRAYAATGPDTWVGNTSALWSVGTNWSGTNAPPLSGDSLIFGLAGSAGPTLNNDLTSAAFNIAGFTFNGPSAFTIGGNDFTLTGNINNSSTVTQTINDNFAMTAARTVTLTAGGGNVALGGNITGTGGSFVLAGTGTLTLSGTNAFTGGVNAQAAGTTVIGRNASAFGGGNIALTTGAQYSTAVFATDANDSFGNNITGATSTSGIINLVSDRATAGAGVTHALGTTNGFSSSGGQILFQAGSNVTSGTAGLSFAASTLGAAGTTNNTVFNAIGTSVSYAGLTATTPSSTTVSGATNFILAGSGTGLAGSTAGGGSVTGAISNSAVNGSATNVTAINKAGSGTWTLSGNNTYTGATTLSGGTLVLDYASTDTSKLANGAALVLNGGTLQLNGGSHAEVIGTLTPTGGGNQVTRTGVGSTATLATGGALNASIQQASTTSGTNSITLPSGTGVFVGQSITGTGIAGGTTVASVSGNVITLSAAPTQTVATNTLTLGFNAGAVNFATGVATTTSQNNFSGILSSRLTVGSVGSADFAANDGAGNLVGYTGYTPLVASGSSILTNYLVSGSFTTTAAQSVNALKITSTAAGQSLTLGSGNFTLRNNALLFTGANDYSIGGAGTLNVTSGPLVIHQYGAGTLTTGTLGSNVEKYGPGTLVFSGANSNSSTAALTINQGTVQFSANTQLGSVAAASGNVILNGGTLVADTTGAAISLTNSGTGRGVTVGLGGGTIDVIGGNSLTIPGVISSTTAGTGSNYSAPLTFGSAFCNGTFILSGANTYKGGTILAGGTVQLGVAEVGNTSGPLGQYGIATAGAQYNYITFAGGTLQYSAANTTDYSGRFAQVANQSFKIDTNNQAVTLATPLAGASSTLTKSGLGTLTLSAANTYTGSTTVSNGTLIVSGSLSGTASVSVAAGATLATGPTGSIATAAAGNVAVTGNLAPGGSSPGAGAGTLNLSLGAGGKLNFAPASTLLFGLGTTSDLVAFNAADDWLGGSGNATLQLDVTLVGFSYANTYTVFNNVTTDGFTFANIAGFDTVNYTANFFDAGSSYQLSFVPVPEPGSLGSLLGGLGMLVGLRRMRRRRS